MIKQPFIFDGFLAAKIGVEEALLLQLIYSGDKIKLDDIEQKFWSRNKIRTIAKILRELNLINEINGIYYVEKRAVALLYREPIREEEELPDLKGQYDAKFEEIWKYYNKDKKNVGSKPKAYEKWRKLPFSKLPITIIKKIIDLYREQVGDTQFMKHFVAFLNQKVYESYAPELVSIFDNKNTEWQGYLFENNEFYAIKDKNVTKINFSAQTIDEFKKNNRIQYKNSK